MLPVGTLLVTSSMIVDRRMDHPCQYFSLRKFPQGPEALKFGRLQARIRLIVRGHTNLFV